MITLTLANFRSDNHDLTSLPQTDKTADGGGLTVVLDVLTHPLQIDFLFFGLHLQFVATDDDDDGAVLVCRYYD